jgi:ribosomal-protein-alanine N-acetyltransferase
MPEGTMKEIPTFHTERLILRPFRLTDAAMVQRLAGDMDIADTTVNIPHPYKDGMAEDWISKHSEAFDKLEGLALAITQRVDGSVVGAISLMAIAKGHQAELGYWIGKPYRNKGFCTEAARSLMRYAFADLGLHRVHASHFSRNPASGRIMSKLGMQHEGTRRHHIRKWDKYEDLELYGILKEEWEITGDPTRGQRS